MKFCRIFHSIKSGFFLIPIESPYYDDKLSKSKKYIYTMALMGSLINVMLLVPDVALTSGKSRIAIIVVRALFSFLLVGFGTRIRNIRTFRHLSVYITLVEALTILIFLYVYSRYTQPNFLIQTIGIITIIMLIFFVPNQWVYMLMTALFGTAGFFASTFAFIRTVSGNELLAAVVYISMAILVCAISAWNADRHQYKEFLAKRELERISSTDYLTNTANRHKMEEEAARWMEFCRRQGFPLCLVFIDVDNLKAINDQYGHCAGDSVLERLANLIRTQIRRSDVIARWGGDEFIVLLPNITFRNAIIITERARVIIRECAFEHDIHMTCSFGVVEMQKESTFKSMVDKADQLMYSSKAKGKDAVEWGIRSQDK